jgi:hypothetical protein
MYQTLFIKLCMFPKECNYVPRLMVKINRDFSDIDG